MAELHSSLLRQFVKRVTSYFLKVKIVLHKNSKRQKVNELEPTVYFENYFRTHVRGASCGNSRAGGRCDSPTRRAADDRYRFLKRAKLGLTKVLRRDDNELGAYAGPASPARTAATRARAARR
ncbi:hypothetical protein EVAR_102776_1 [Eumeta japonica]|uniref:Uncharacterized protein n=1 Tax=Eumeta variegata TaxID=151549 RepID=A0A4C1THW6_EUMVA|nr:hypothetical protein EVAR_102776_1 [Eumeta japonica]